jgi:hypothetical protein
MSFLQRTTGEQRVEGVLTEDEKAFIQQTAFPQLDAVTEDRTLEKCADALWNLCLWEGQRTTTIDTKAAALTGLSSLAAAVVSASSATGAPQSTALIVARCVSITLFVVTVLLSLNVQRASSPWLKGQMGST